MALEVGEVQTKIERRHKSLHIERDFATESLRVTIEYADGFYKDGKWYTLETGSITIEGEPVFILMQLTNKNLGVDECTIGKMLEAGIYGVIGGQIKTTFKLTLIIKDQQGNPVFARCSMQRQEGENLVEYNVQEGEVIVIEDKARVNMTLKVFAPGYKEFSKYYTYLVGELVEEVVLEPDTQA
ncbi:hypothetical protein YS40_140 [Thermus phage phiYS40]|uniref:hypothetical protein n=1 Tax=Thermus phage phiYS40 TaxID=407392 RepID=UPI0000E68A02|nr:hypothetical protein YS40_140 [Thermus phage phiYS40]ABJ91534.1 hypothetical protein YS40_140 [Thermus phage phiYS40]BAK53658.1 hypothetical protein YSP_140 [Thermus phage phiYS40]